MPTNEVYDPVEEGQFDDALTSGPATDPRQGNTYIDDEGLLEWSSGSSEEDESEPDEFEQEEDIIEAEAFQTLRAEDEDWEIAERDFTKQYNRIRQHVAVRTGAAQGVASAIDSKAAVAPLPAVNRPRQSKTIPTPTAQQREQHARDKTENQLQALSKYSSRLRNLDMPYDLGVGVNRKGPSASANMKDKSDRATSEQVLDPRTRIILFKMIGRGLIFEVNGCVSTGKEVGLPTLAIRIYHTSLMLQANVYHALTPERKHLALKIYKTSILVFKDRDRYVSGEYRFRRGYSRHNPRKMVRVWAEKEMRNLKRLRTAGINCPDPVEVRENILVMTFVGDKDGWASPRLKDADIPDSAFPDLYVELMLMTRKIFTECKLVHADLSEYNVLYHVDDEPQPTPPAKTPGQLSTDGTAAPEPREQTDSSPPPPQGHLCIIDVSQSDFFSKRGVRTVGLRRAFEVVTRDQLSQDGGKTPEEVLREWMDTPEHEETGSEGSAASGKAHEDEVFMQSYIPRTLNEDTIGIVASSRSKKAPGDETDRKQESTQKKSVSFAGDEEAPASGSGGEEPDEEEGEDDDSEEEQDGYEEKKPRGHRHEDKEAKKERKKAAKEEAREKRKHKIPKAEKKRRVKATARGG
ncbi:RIO1 family-domain-containing protein [Fomes fomentarius]|nr:RIO1 family-domain-containing protein [Fomes fomentarius]